MNTTQWPALESDPEIFNDYFHKAGIPNEVFFRELLSLEYKDFMQIEGPLIAVMLNFQRGIIITIREQNRILPSSYVPFFMKQTEILDNACGLIAGLHSFGNHIGNGNIKLSNETIITRYFNSAISENSLNRAKILENFNEFKTIHSEFANQGQSELAEEVKNHYVCFIYYNEGIIELDGLTEGPYLVQDNVREEDFLPLTTAEIMRRVSNQEIDEKLNVMIIGNENTKIIDLFE